MPQKKNNLPYNISNFILGDICCSTVKNSVTTLAGMCCSLELAEDDGQITNFWHAFLEITNKFTHIRNSQKITKYHKNRYNNRKDNELLKITNITRASSEVLCSSIFIFHNPEMSNKQPIPGLPRVHGDSL